MSPSPTVAVISAMEPILVVVDGTIPPRVKRPVTVLPRGEMAIIFEQYVK